MSGSIMPGSNEGYTKIAAVAKGEPCRSHMGPDTAAHYLGMVHNGIEYAVATPCLNAAPSYFDGYR